MDFIEDESFERALYGEALLIEGEAHRFDDLRFDRLDEALAHGLGGECLLRLFLTARRGSIPTDRNWPVHRIERSPSTSLSRS